jgi:hypothetical protein
VIANKINRLRTCSLPQTVVYHIMKTGIKLELVAVHEPISTGMIENRIRGPVEVIREKLVQS